MNKERIYLFLTYFIVFLFQIFPYSDSDWGWHLKYGEYFLKTGVPLRYNLFSWSLPNFQWTNHEWLYDPILYVLYTHIGYIGLILAGALISFLTFYIIIHQFKLSYWKVGVLGFFFIKISEVGIFQSFRSQVISILIFSLLVSILIKAKKRMAPLVFIPPLFLFWANMHGTFLLGLAIVAIFLGSYVLEDIVNKKTQILKKLSIFLGIGLVTILLTLVNPFGYKIYLEALKHSSNPYLQNIMEWTPIISGCPSCHKFTFFAYSGILALIFIKFRKLANLPYIILFLFLGLASIEMKRYLPIFVVVTLPILAERLQNLKINMEKYKSTNYISIIIISVLISFNFFNRFINFNLYKYSEADYCHFSGDCSPKMADYLIKNPPSGKGFNFYDWGGYYIGKGIPFKLFIDGRMHLWKQDDYMPFADYVAMYYDGDNKKFNEYNFDWVLVPLSSDIGQKIYNSDDLGKWQIQFVDADSIFYIKRE